MEAQLTRFALEEPVMPEEVALAPLQHELATKAGRLLGYGLFEEHLQGPIAQKIQDYAELKNLTQLFQELNIKPYDAHEVEQYQLSERRKLNFKSFLAIPWYAKIHILIEGMLELISRPLHSDGAQALFGLGVCVGGIASVICFFSGAMHAGIILSPLLFLLLCAVYICNAPKKLTAITIKEWEWKKLTFAECHTQKVEIPLFALDTAVRVAEKIPGADLHVEALLSTERAIGDPFLCLTHGGVKYYLEVWDENRFERKARQKS